MVQYWYVNLLFFLVIPVASIQERAQEIFDLLGKDRGFRGHWHPVDAIAFSPDDKLLVSGSRDGTVWVWDVKTEQELNMLGHHLGNITSVKWNKNGDRIAAASEKAGKIFVWEWPVREPAKEPTVLSIFKSSKVFELDFSPVNDVKLASASSDNKIRIWNITTLSNKISPHFQIGRARRIVYSPHGRHLAVECYGGSASYPIIIYNTHTHAIIAQFYNDDDSRALYSPDSKQMVIGNSRGCKLYDTRDYHQIAAIVPRGIVSGWGYNFDLSRLEFPQHYSSEFTLVAQQGREDSQGVHTFVLEDLLALELRKRYFSLSPEGKPFFKENISLCERALLQLIGQHMRSGGFLQNALQKIVTENSGLSAPVLQFCVKNGLAITVDTLRARYGLKRKRSSEPEQTDNLL